jgi:chromosome segregation ATPase
VKAELAERKQTIEQLEAEVKMLRVQLQQSKWTEEELNSASEQIAAVTREQEVLGQAHEDSIRLLEDELEMTKTQLENVRANSINDRAATNSPDSRVAELENELASLTKSLWAATESELVLRKELETNRLELEKKTAELSAAVSDDEKHRHQIQLLTEVVEKLGSERSKLSGHDESAPNDTKSLAVRVLELEQLAIERQQLNAQLQEAMADLRRDEDIVNEWEGTFYQFLQLNGPAFSDTKSYDRTRC